MYVHSYINISKFLPCTKANNRMSLHLPTIPENVARSCLLKEKRWGWGGGNGLEGWRILIALAEDSSFVPSILIWLLTVSCN